jgi:hypothetical protein
MSTIVHDPWAEAGNSHFGNQHELPNRVLVLCAQALPAHLADGREDAFAQQAQPLCWQKPVRRAKLNPPRPSLQQGDCVLGDFVGRAGEGEGAQQFIRNESGAGLKIEAIGGGFEAGQQRRLELHLAVEPGDDR